jgi:HK97 family phage prohead protease
LREAKHEKNGLYSLLWSHQPTEVLGGITPTEDGKGLPVIGQLNLEVQSAREKRALMKQGVIRGLSIGYDAVKWDFDPIEKIRHLKEIALWEISLVVFPADKNAQVSRIKSVPYTDFGGLMDLLNELDIKDIDPRFQEAAKRAADRIYALLKVQEPSSNTPEIMEPLHVKQPSLDSLFTALDKLNHTLSGGK